MHKELNMNLQPQNTGTPSPSLHCFQVAVCFSSALLHVNLSKARKAKFLLPPCTWRSLWVCESPSEEVAVLSTRRGRRHFVLPSVTPGLAYTVLGFVWFPGAYVTSGGVSARPCITGQRWAPASQSTNLPVRVTSPVKKAQAPKIVQLIIKKLRWICTQVQKKPLST